jgi:hypothetical protein
VENERAQAAVASAIADANGCMVDVWANVC